MPEHEKRELAELQDQETRLVLLSFNTSAIWEFGSTLRSLAIKDYPEQSACISIVHANGTPLFVTHTADAISPVHQSEMEAIRSSVKRWEISSWRRQRLLTLSERQDSEATPKASEYSQKGGGWPIRVRGVVGVVAMVVVTGLYPLNGKAPGFNPLKYDPPTDVNHELIVRALELSLERQRNMSSRP